MKIKLFKQTKITEDDLTSNHIKVKDRHDLEGCVADFWKPLMEDIAKRHNKSSDNLLEVCHIHLDLTCSVLRMWYICEKGVDEVFFSGSHIPHQSLSTHNRDRRWSRHPYIRLFSTAHALLMENYDVKFWHPAKEMTERTAEVMLFNIIKGFCSSDKWNCEGFVWLGCASCSSLSFYV
jgi:hypothetical protein